MRQHCSWQHTQTAESEHRTGRLDSIEPLPHSRILHKIRRHHGLTSNCRQHSIPLAIASGSAGPLPRGTPALHRCHARQAPRYSGEPSMQAITTVGLDIAKSVFQVHGVDAAVQVVIRRQLRRRYVLVFLQQLTPCLIGIEACASSHHWSSELKALGHTVRLMPVWSKK